MTGVIGKPSLLWINEGKVGPDQPPVEIYDSEAHLIAVLKQAVADGLRCFVTSNSKTKIATIAAVLEKEFGSERKLIVVTADTGGTEEVVDFIGDVATRTLEYDVILTSPSLGTGVDISFPEQAKLIDVVFGFFEAQITTHFDCDQQLGRVRHPKAIKIWINPRRFHYETSFDVVKHDLLRESLYKNLLVGYTNGEPVYNEEDAFISMAALVLSQQRASKNNLKRHFIEYKKHQGYTIRIVAADQAVSAAGRALRKIGKEVGWASPLRVEG